MKQPMLSSPRLHLFPRLGRMLFSLGRTEEQLAREQEDQDMDEKHQRTLFRFSGLDTYV